MQTMLGAAALATMLLLGPAAAIPFYEGIAYEGDVQIVTERCAGAGAARLDIEPAYTPGLIHHPHPTTLTVEGACPLTLRLWSEYGGDGGHLLVDAIRQNDAGFLGTNGGFPVGNGSFTLYMDYEDPFAGRIFMLGTYLLPADEGSFP